MANIEEKASRNFTKIDFNTRTKFSVKLKPKATRNQKINKTILKLLSAAGVNFYSLMADIA